MQRDEVVWVECAKGFDRRFNNKDAERCDGANGNIMLRLALETERLTKMLQESKDLQSSSPQPHD